MLLNTILKAIKELEAIEQPTPEVERVLTNLKDAVDVRMRENLMDFISVGDKMGYDTIKKQLHDVLGFIEGLEEK